MKLATIRYQNIEQIGMIVSNDTAVIPLSKLGITCHSMLSLIQSVDTETLEHLAKKECESSLSIPLTHVSLEAPIPHPPHDLLCLGRNYAAHAEESARFLGASKQSEPAPVYFSKRVLRATGSGGTIPAHDSLTQQLDYEAELAVVIGKTASHIAPEEVPAYIFGYMVANDVSARDLQRKHVQYTFAKGLDGFACLGPWIVTADEIPNPQDLGIRSYVNGKLRQDASLSDLIHSIPEIISHLSQGMTLCPGDIILTGTPAGVGMGFSPPRFLKKGDVVVCEIDRIGTLENTIGA